ncbi:uncharacterized protein ACA1_309660 [Acanthamoeba castellanii str. Neff]|uniref:FF domain-containing protein n=1 Tax=Acanthamoeba castellanii (strain ATCC 30010 / Neff) TaxID=1257118 RepID=L8GI00_ACACF|nr:uncharacterized protein ACA1_309660 [Acanthamoeba castellanii str. Neff]ELR12577.1 hypothetical protein ACA1_309660 [Acanthamoeba castellanii str. Neff]
MDANTTTTPSRRHLRGKCLPSSKPCKRRWKRPKKNRRRRPAKRSQPTRPSLHPLPRPLLPLSPHKSLPPPSPRRLSINRPCPLLLFAIKLPRSPHPWSPLLLQRCLLSSPPRMSSNPSYATTYVHGARHTTNTTSTSHITHSFCSGHITPTATWDTTMRTIIKDERYKVLSSITERKAAFREYIEDVKTRDREERKAKEDALRNDFFAMLRQGEIDASSTYRKAMTMFDRDPRWKAVDREKDREDLFDDYIWELETKQREEERNNRESNLKAFHQLLDEYVLSVTTQWRKFRDDVKDDPRYSALDKLDRLALFEHRIRDLERVEAEEKRKSRETQRRQYRKNRDTFRALLREAYDAGKLDRNSKWKRFKRTIKEDPRYEDLIGQPGSTPSELYGDFVEDLQERYEETKRIIDRITKEGNITITSWMAEDQFLAAISTHPSYPNLDQPSASKIFAEMRDQVDRREKREKRKREKNFTLMLKSHKDKITAASVYDDAVRELLAEEASYKAIPAEEERKALFESYVDHLKNRPADYESSSEEEGMIESESEEDRDRKRRHKDRKDKDRKRRRHSSKDRDDDKHKKRRKHSDKDKERKHKKSRGEEKKRGRREGSEEGELVPTDHHAEKEEGEMDE